MDETKREGEKRREKRERKRKEIVSINTKQTHIAPEKEE